MSLKHYITVHQDSLVRQIHSRIWSMAQLSARISPTDLGQAGSEQHTLEQLAHPLQELVHMWPLQDVHLWTTEMASGPPGSGPQRFHVCGFNSSLPCVFAAGGHFLKQVIENRPSRREPAYPGLLEPGRGPQRNQELRRPSVASLLHQMTPQWRFLFNIWTVEGLVHHLQTHQHTHSPSPTTNTLGGVPGVWSPRSPREQ